MTAIPRQSQESFTDQLIELHRLAVVHGLYETADWLAKWLAAHGNMIHDRKATDA